MTEVYVELVKLFKKPRTYIGPAAMLCISALVMVGMKYGGQAEYMQDQLGREMLFSGSILNASFLAWSMLTPAVVFTLMPLFTCAVFGDLLASESADGTMRTLLCRPVSRLRVLAAKYAAGVLYTLLLAGATAVGAYLLGAIFLGRGALLYMESGIWVLPERTAALRLIEAYALLAASMIAVGSLAFAVSTFLANSNGAIAGAMGFLIACAIVGGIPFFHKVAPYLITSHLAVGHVFSGPDVKLAAGTLWTALAYSAGAFGLSLLVFARKDVLS
ncbi:MAG: ABC transporter permease [Armatimonadota bacterium]